VQNKKAAEAQILVPLRSRKTGHYAYRSEHENINRAANELRQKDFASNETCFHPAPLQVHSHVVLQIVRESVIKLQ